MQCLLQDDCVAAWDGIQGWQTSVSEPRGCWVGHLSARSLEVPRKVRCLAASLLPLPRYLVALFASLASLSLSPLFRCKSTDDLHSKILTSDIDHNLGTNTHITSVQCSAHRRTAAGPPL